MLVNIVSSAWRRNNQMHKVIKEEIKKARKNEEKS